MYNRDLFNKTEEEKLAWVNLCNKKYKELLDKGTPVKPSIDEYLAFPAEEREEKMQEYDQALTNYYQYFKDIEKYNPNVIYGTGSSAIGVMKENHGAITYSRSIYVNGF